MPLNHQRHHLVPDNIVKNHPLYKYARDKGWYDIDRASNGRYLAESSEDMVEGVSKNYPTHNGSHPQYDDAINSAIDDIVEANELDISNLNLTKNEVTSILDDIEESASDVLENWQYSRVK